MFRSVFLILELRGTQLALLFKTNRMPQQPWPNSPSATTVPSLAHVTPGFLLQRVTFMQSELAVLQQRMEVLQADIGTALRELQALSRMNPNVSGDANTS